MSTTMQALDEHLEGAPISQSPTGIMSVLHTQYGDKELSWDKGKSKEVEDARASFDFLRLEAGYTPYKVDPATGKATEIMTAFDPSAEKIIMKPNMVGG